MKKILLAFVCGVFILLSGVPSYAQAKTVVPLKKNVVIKKPIVKKVVKKIVVKKKVATHSKILSAPLIDPNNPPGGR